MCNLRKLVVSCIFILLVIGLFLTCDDPNSPFTNSMGEKVVVEAPTINIEFPVSGSYITSEREIDPVTKKVINKRDPDTGELIFDPVTFVGRAHAYIKVEKVEVYVFEDKDNGQREVKWTDKGIKLSGDLKNKRWTFEFDPNNYNNYDFENGRYTTPQDGPIRMLFRVFDSTGRPVESVPLVYIIKNRPSVIKMASPSMTDIANAAKAADIPWGGDIRGTVIDRRGLKPGYPQMKIWPASLPLPAGKDEPDDDDPTWGYVSLFLTMYDDMEKETGVAPAGPGIYADRSKIRVVNASSFGYRLAERDETEPDPAKPGAYRYKSNGVRFIDPDNPDFRPVQYKVDANGKHVLFGPGTVFNFKIRTSDTSSDPLNKMIPTDEGPFITGFFPPLNFGNPNEDPFEYRVDPSGRGQPVKINVFNADSRPMVEINNDDLGVDELSRNAILNDRPNIYITEPSSRKIQRVGTADQFRLRLLASFTEGGKIYGTTLTWTHESTGRSGILNWDSVEYPAGTSLLPIPADGIDQAYFTFTATGAMLYTDGLPIFRDSSEPYILTFTVKTANSDDPGIKHPEYRYVLYMDGKNPAVSIRSVRGSANNPKAAENKFDGLVNPDPYNVNGNIQVVVDRTDDSGIMPFRSSGNMGQTPLNENNLADEGRAMVKWIIEPATQAETQPAATGTILESLVKFKSDPSAANLQFFYNIGDSKISGWVKRPDSLSAIAADRSNNFKINTKDYDKQYLWLYVIAQDQVQNLGFIVQKIYVDEETDRPILNIPTLSKINGNGDAINAGDDLNVTVDLSVPDPYKMTRNWPRKNILGRNDDIDLNLIDDDGIETIRNAAGDITAISGLTIKLTVLDPVTDLKGRPASVDFTPAQIMSVITRNSNRRDMSGKLTQTIMANALYGEALASNSLKDGIYRLDFTLKDDCSEEAKVWIKPHVNDGDTPVSVYSTDANNHVETYFFAVSNSSPVVEITEPKDNAWGSEEPIIIKGTAKSRLNIQNLWITFSPDVVTVSVVPGSTQTNPAKIQLTPEQMTATADADGFYNYTWEYAPLNPNTGKNGVVFHPKKPGGDVWYTDDLRRFTVEAYDRLGNMGSAVRTVQIDNQPPDVSLSDFNYGRPEETIDGKKGIFVYGKVSFTVSASDANGLYEVDGKSGIRWWVISTTELAALPGNKPSWGTGYETPAVSYGFKSYSNPDFKPALAPASWTGYGNFNLNQSDGGRYTWIIDTRYLIQKEEYNLCIIAMDTAGNPSTQVIYETFTVDHRKDYPVIDEISLDPAAGSIAKRTDVTSSKGISGTVSDADLFNPANKNTYVSIRFPKAAAGKPVQASDWDEWISINIADTYSTSRGGIDPSGAIAYKFKVSEYTSATPPAPPAELPATTPANRAYNYLSKDGVKYYQIRVTDEPTGPTAANAKWYGKNPDYFMTVAPASANYPGYPYLLHNSVSIVFPADKSAAYQYPNLPNENPPDAYNFVVDDTYPEIFFTTWDPTPPTPLIPRPGYSETRPTFSTAELLIKELKGYVDEYKLSDLSMTYTSKGKTFTKLIINNIKDPPTFATDPADGKYPWDLSANPDDPSDPSKTVQTKLDITPTGADYLFKQIFDAADQGMQIITFEATDMVPFTRRVTYVFQKDTQGPEINFNINRSIKRDNLYNGATFDTPDYPATQAGPPEIKGWPSDWRYGGTDWQATNAVWTVAWRLIIENWPSEYAFKTTTQINDALKAEHTREPSTVIGDPEPDPTKPVPANYAPPVIEGTFNDLYSSVRITVPATAKTYFYYRFKKADGTVLTNSLTNTDITASGNALYGDLDISLFTQAAAPYPWLEGKWIRKEIEPAGATQNEKEANWKIWLDKANGFNGTDGLNLLDMWAMDSAGNISDIYNVRFYLDRAPPVLGEEPNPEDLWNPGEKLTDAGEFIIFDVTGQTGWASKSLKEKQLPEMMRVFSADGAANDDNVAFKIQGTVSDHNFSGMTITIGQEGFTTYSVTSKAVIDPTATITAGSPLLGIDDDNAATKRLSITGGGNTDGYEGAPRWTWTLSILNKDIKGLRDAAYDSNPLKDASDSARRFIRVTASDKANKRVGPVDWFFYLDTKKPTLEYTNLKTGTLKDADSFEDSKLTLTGLVQDDTKIKDVKFTIGRWSYATNEWTWWDGSKWTAAAAPTLATAAAWPSVFTSDTAPTRQTSMNWTINQATLTTAGTTKFPANLFDQEGYYRLDLLITDFSIGSGNPHYTYNAGDLFTDENYKPTDTPPKTTMSGRVFYIDKKDPTLQWGWVVWNDVTKNWDPAPGLDDPYNPNNTTYFRNDGGQAKLSLTVGDGNTIQYWHVKVVDNSTQSDILNSALSGVTHKSWIGGETGTTAGTPASCTFSFDTARTTLTISDHTTAAINGAYTKTGPATGAGTNLASFAGTWNASGNRSFVFAGNTFTYKVNGATTNFGSFTAVPDPAPATATGTINFFITPAITPIPNPGICSTDIDEKFLIVAPFMTKDGAADNTADNESALDVVLKRLPTYTITVTVKDGAGRTSSISKQFTLDNTPPRFIQNNFSPLSYERGDDNKPAEPKKVLAPGYTPEETTRTYSYDAVTARLNIRGSTTDNSNQIRRISYYVVNNNDTPNFSNSDVAFPTPKWITDNNKWRYSGGASGSNNDPIIATTGGTTLLEIDQGTFAWRIMVPQTSLFTSDSSAGAYVQTAQTGGIGIDKNTYPATTYNDVTSISETSAPVTRPTVPKLTFPGLANKTIYGGEQVALLTVYVRAEDMAGNVSYDLLKYWIWPEGDRPIVTSINNPNGARDPDTDKLIAPDSDRLLNGTIRLSGMAKDNERVKYVWFRVLPSSTNQTTGVTEITGDPYELEIPKWNEETWEAIPGQYQDPVKDITALFTTPGQYLGKRRLDDPPPKAATVQPIPNSGGNGGWYMANGGNSPEVSWWAYINTQGELDPKDGSPKKEFTVQVRAQDVSYDDKNSEWMTYGEKTSAKPGDYRGLASVPMEVNAWVVTDLPVFTNKKIAPDTSENAENSTPKLWADLDKISIRKRSSYKVTVSHDLGLGAIRWSPTLWDKTQNSNNGAFVANPRIDSFNLLAVNPASFPTYDPAGTVNYVWLNENGDGYVVGNKAAADTALSDRKTAMALHVVGKNPIAGSSPAIYKDYDVFVDMNADMLLAKMIADDDKYGTYEMEPTETGYDKSDANKGRAGQVRNSVRYPVYLSASDKSKATPLTARGDELLPIDNLAPYGMYTLNRKPAGIAATIGGEAGDKGPVNGVAKVVLWFSRYNSVTNTRTFISWHEKVLANVTTLPAASFTEAPTTKGAPGWWDDDGVIAAWNSANSTKPQIQKPYIPDISTTGAAGAASLGASAIVIDRNSPSTGQDAYGHKLPMGFADGGIGKIWYVEINTFGITSGPVTLHYVVIDKAGNARYYSEPLIIMNNAPAISQIKLATDIRDNNDFRTKWTAPARVGKGSTATPTEAPAAGTEILDFIRGKVPLGSTGVEKGISEYIYPNALTVTKVIDFNVRNKLLAVRIETVKGPDSTKKRSFRLEYVSGAVIKSDTGGTGQKLTDMKAGRVYIIKNPGTARWGAIGAEGDGPWPIGYAFIAAVDGTNEDGDSRIDGTGSAWELNSAYYNAAGTRTLPPLLNLGDVSYAANASAENTDAVSAEFVYNFNAFGTTAGSTIIDYTNTSDSYPPADAADAAMTQALLGNSMFILRVFDGEEYDQFGDFAIIRIRVNNDDKTKPFAQLYDLNPMTEGVDRPQSRQRSLTPMFIGEGGSNSNRLKGGLWNTDPENKSISKPGHIEPRKMTTGYGSAATGNLYTTTQTGETVARNHSLSSAQMGGAATRAAATVQKPWANPEGFFATDTVSGQVVLRGYVEDNERIEQVDLLIGSSTIPILTYYNNAAQNTTPGAAGYGQTADSSTYQPPRTGLLQIPTGANTTDRVYFADSIDLYRHRVEWAYVWDTETIPANTVFDTNVNVRVRASNRNSVATNANKQSDNTPAPGTVHTSTSEANIPDANTPNTTPNTSPKNPSFPVGLNKYNSINMNLRPYITGFKRDASKFFHNNRSMQGWTAFARGEEVVVEGFNIGRATPAATTNISIPGATDVTANAVNAAQQNNFVLASTAANRYRIFTIGANATPGTVTLTAGGFQVVNTGTERPQVSGAFVIQPWNIEYSPAIDGSQLWDDTRSVHIWQSNDTRTGNADRGSFRSTNMNWYIMSPSMSIDPRDGTLWASHNEGGSSIQNSGSTYISSNKDDTLDRRAAFIDPILFSDIYYSTGGGSNGAAYWSAFSIIGRYGTYQNWPDLGGVYIHGPGGSDPGLQNRANNTTHYIAESTWYNASSNSSGLATPPSTDQFMNPHIVTFVNPQDQQYEHIHVSYYDSKDGSIKYRYNRRNSPGTVNSTGASYAWTNLDGGYDAEDLTALSASTPFNAVSANGRVVGWGTTRVQTPGMGHNIDAGEHNSIAVTSGGYPYVAYFDKTNQKLKLAVSNSATPYAAANWKIIENVIPTNNASFKGTGQFVSMKIDTKDSNRVHIAALNSINKQLVYVTGFANFASATLTDTVVQVVDSVGMVGRWCALSLDANGNPWISYQDESNIGSMDGVKMAFLNTTKFGKAANDIYGASVRGWETMHVPAQFRVENPIDSGREHGRLGMECYPTRNYTGTASSKFWSGAVSYRAPDLYRIAYYVK